MGQEKSTVMMGEAERIKVSSLDIIVTMIDQVPYYEIKYKELGKNHYNIGYSSYELANVLAWKDEYFELVENGGKADGFDKGVIGKPLPADSTLNNMKKYELIELLHIAESNHKVLTDAYANAVDTSKCNRCPLMQAAKKVGCEEGDFTDRMITDGYAPDYLEEELYSVLDDNPNGLDMHNLVRDYLEESHEF
nr:MAG TPA: hypothetical protein [Bacteriophage sp.]